MAARKRKEFGDYIVSDSGICGGVLTFGMDDRQEIIPLLHSLHHPTFFTCDQDFYHPWLRHPEYCLVFLEVSPEEAAHYIRRSYAILSFRTQAQRMGKIVRLHEDGISSWQQGAGKAEFLAW